MRFSILSPSNISSELYTCCFIIASTIFYDLLRRVPLQVLSFLHEKDLFAQESVFCFFIATNEIVIFKCIAFTTRVQ